MAELTPVQKLKAIIEEDIEFNSDWDYKFIDDLAARLEELEELQVEPQYSENQIEQINRIYERWIG